jgi:probable F420-dependent oxidoreductase
LKFGIALEGIRRVTELGSLAARVEALGFDSLWAPDHLSYSQPVCDPFQVLSICAAATRTIRLGTCVYLLPLRHPAHTAKMTASLDWLSSGRLTLGVGVGGEFPGEFAACEVPLAERGRRANEAIPILRALWSGETPPAGRLFHVPRTRIEPTPVQASGPPIWVGGRSEAALRRTATLADGYLGYFLDADGIRTRMARIRELAGSSRPIVCALMAFARIERDGRSALARAQHRLGALYGTETRSAAERFGIIGTIEQCRERIAELAAAGVEHLLLSPIVEGDDLDTQLEALASFHA